MSETLISFSYVIGAFFVKLAAVTFGAVAFRRRCPDAIAAWLASWLVFHTGMLLVMLGLSIFGALTTQAAWALLGVSLALSAMAAWLRRTRLCTWSSVRSAAPGLALFAAAFLVMAARSAIYPDFTWDAQTYGLVRLAMWVSHGSILVHMPTVQINVFTNEWNAEVISLLYGLAAGNLQGFMFGTVEVLLVTFAAATWLALRLGAGRFWATVIGAVVASTPACLGLAGVLKGDLLAVAAIMMAAGWLTLLGSSPVLASAMLIASLALSVGSKITAVFCVFGLAAVGLAFARKSSWPSLARGSAIGLAMAFILLSRYMANLVVYGDPLKRVAGESAQPGFGNLVAGLEMVVAQMFQFSVKQAGLPTFGWLLAGGMGLTMFLAVASTGLQWANGARPNSVRLTLIAVALAAISATAFITPTYQWSFRYYLPMVMIFAVGLLAAPLRELWPKARMVVVTGAFAVIAVNSSYPFWPGEINGNRTFEAAVSGLEGASSRDRSLFMLPDVRREYGVDEFDFDGLHPQSFAVLAEWNRPVSPFAGTRGQNKIYLAATIQELVAATQAHCPDFVAVTKLRPGRVVDDGQFERLGYAWVKDSSMVAIANLKDKPSCEKSAS